MAKLFVVSVATQAARSVNVVAETPEEAQTKVTLSEGESVTGVVDQGDVVV